MDDDTGCTACNYKGETRWRLIVLEDAGELIMDDAKKSSGQALSRLLNMTDGILGEGRKVLVAITTNEKVTDLHPAIMRPGRCLVSTEIPALSRDESVSWLNDPQLNYHVGDGATLAELYHIKAGAGKNVVPEVETSDTNTGQYL